MTVHFPSGASHQWMSYGLHYSPKTTWKPWPVSDCGGILAALQCYCNCYHEYLFESCAKVLSVPTMLQLSPFHLGPPPTWSQLTPIPWLVKTKRQTTKQNKINQTKKLTKKPQAPVECCDRSLISYTRTIYQEVLIKGKKKSKFYCDKLYSRKTTLKSIFQKVEF